MKNLFLLLTLIILTMSCEKAKINSLEKDLDGSFGVYHYLNSHGEKISDNALLVSKNNHMELSVDGLVVESGYFHVISANEIMWNDCKIHVAKQHDEYRFDYDNNQNWILMKKFNN